MIDRVKRFFNGRVPQKIFAMLKVVAGLVAHNFIQKMLSLISAFMMWFFVMEAQDPTIEGSYEVALTTSNAPYEYFVTCTISKVWAKAVTNSRRRLSCRKVLNSSTATRPSCT